MLFCCKNQHNLVTINFCKSLSNTSKKACSCLAR